MGYGRHTAEVERLLDWLATADDSVTRALIAGNEVRRSRMPDDDVYGDVLRFTARTKDETLQFERDRKSTLAGLLQRAGLDSESDHGKQVSTAILVGAIAVAARDLVTGGEFAILVAPLRDAGYAFGDYDSPPAEYGVNQGEVERFLAWARGADAATAQGIVAAEQHPFTPAEIVARKTASERRTLADLPTAYISRDVRAATSSMFTSLGDGSEATRAALRSGIQVAANAIAKRHVLTADEFEIATRSARTAGYVLDLSAPVYEPVPDPELPEIGPDRYGPNTAEIARLIAWIARADRGTGLAILQADDAQTALAEVRDRLPRGLPKLSAAQGSALDKDRNAPLVRLAGRTVDDDMLYARAQLRSVLTTAISAVAARDQLPPDEFTRIVAVVAAAGYDFAPAPLDP